MSRSTSCEDASTRATTRNASPTFCAPSISPSLIDGALQPLELLALLPQPFELGLHRVESLFDLRWAGAELVGDPQEPFLLFDQVGLGGPAGERLNAARARGHGGLAQDVDEADLAGVVDVRAAAQLRAERRVRRP